MSRAVLDASAVLALLHEERGAAEVVPWIAEGVMSAVNVAETVGKLIEAGVPEGPALSALEGLALEVVAFNAPMAVQAGVLRAQTRSLGLSLGDRACLATALSLKLPVVTMDRAWSRLELGLLVHVVR